MEAASERIKGTLLLSRLRFLSSKGPDELERVLTGLAPADQQKLRGMLLPSSWYSLELLRRLESAMVSRLRYASRNDLFVDMGRATASANLTGNGSQRAYVREGDPHFLLQHSSYMYAATHTSGSRTYEATGERSAVLRTTGPAADLLPEDCLTTVGWLAAAIEIAGGRQVRVVESQCTRAGAPCCEYRCEWEAAAATSSIARRA